MKRWVEYIRSQGDNEFVWDTGGQLGDWLAMDAPDGNMKGATDKYFIATAFYAYSTEILIKTLNVLDEDSRMYNDLYDNIVTAFHKRWPIYKTQTECALALVFNLSTDKEKTAAQLAELIRNNGNKLATGFIGTPYLLHALSENGYSDVAYSLLLQTECPSWLYSVKMGATTMWEHWDSKNEKGEFWSSEMNSFNHYAYGSVASWMYEVIAGIKTDEAAPGFKHIIIEPIVDKRLDYAEASVDTVHGRVSSRWERQDKMVIYTVEIPTSATFILGGEKTEIEGGIYRLISENNTLVTVEKL